MEPLNPKTSGVGRRVAFTCNALEGDAVSFSWTKNGRIVQAGGKYSIMTNDEGSMFTIKSVSTEDSGNYTCIASNALSEDRSTASLVVEGEKDMTPSITFRSCQPAIVLS